MNLLSISDIKRYSGHSMLYLVWFLFIFTIISHLFGLFWIFGWLDMPMHFLGGMFLGFLILYAKPVIFIDDTKKTFLVFFIIALIIGIGWEFFELFVDIYIKHISLFWLDTISDIFFDLAGAGAAYLFLLNKNPITKP